MADPGFPNGGARARRRRRLWREDRGAEGAEGGRVWGGGVPLPTGGGVWGGIFHLKKSEFQCIMGSILSQFSCPFTAKNSVFGFQNLQMKALPARREQTARRLLEIGRAHV